MKVLTLSIAVSLAAAAVLAPRSAAACGAPPDYVARQDEGGDVSILTSAVTCSPDRVMLRQNVDTGEIVRLVGPCEGESWVDRCVPEGHYRYGLEVPMPVLEADCVCGPYTYYADVTVARAPESCSTSTVAVASVPWKDDRRICSPSPVTCGSGAPGSDPVPCDAPPPAASGCSSSGSSGGNPWLPMVALVALAVMRVKARARGRAT